jgi:glutamine amidotransferase
LSPKRTLVVTIFDYGVGNLHSIGKALDLAGADVGVATTIEDVLEAEAIVFPGVGDFGAVMKAFGPKRRNLVKRMEDGVPTLGICIGLQIMFESSEEARAKGLGFMKGEVKRFNGVRIPHMGWNLVEVTTSGRSDPMLKGIPKKAYFYYANSYAPRPRGGRRLAITEYDFKFPSIMRKSNTYGAQFHPEKSGRVGLRLIKNWVRFAEGCVCR